MATDLGVSFAEAAAAGLEELGALDPLEAEEGPSEPEVDAGAGNQPDGEGNAGNDEGVFGELNASDDDTNLDDGSVIDVPGVGQVSVQELVAGYMKNTDYTQKTQLLAEQRKTNEKAEKLLELLQDDPVNTIRQLAQSQGLEVGQQGGAWNRVDANDRGKNGRDFSNGELDAMTVQTQIKDALKEALANDPGLVAAREEAVRVKVASHFKALEEKHHVELTGDDRKLILQTAADLGSTDLDYVYFKLNQELEAKHAKQKQLVDVASQSGTRTSGEPEGTSDENIEGFSDALAAAMRELKLEDLN